MIDWTTVKAKCANLHKSLTIWFNTVMGTAIVVLPVAQDQFPALQGYVPDKWYHYTMGALVVGNILLRFKTNRPLQEK